jgi:hypothetical protein
MRPILFGIDPRIVLVSVGMEVRMNRLYIVNGLLLLAALGLSWPVLADEPQDVPLAGSWGWNMKAPGMQKLPNDQLLKESMQALFPPMIDNQPVYDRGQGFAVVGTGREALQHAHDIWAKEQPMKDVLPADTELSIVLQASNDNVELASVTRDYYPHLGHEAGQYFEVKYQWPYVRSTMEQIKQGPTEIRRYDWAGVALIPIGKLPVGRYEVRIIRVPFTPKPDETLIPIPPEWESTLICNSFVFKVKESEQATPPKTATRNE